MAYEGGLGGKIRRVRGAARVAPYNRLPPVGDLMTGASNLAKSLISHVKNSFGVMAPLSKFADKFRNIAPNSDCGEKDSTDALKRIHAAGNINGIPSMDQKPVWPARPSEILAFRGCNQVPSKGPLIIFKNQRNDTVKSGASLFNISNAENEFIRTNHAGPDQLGPFKRVPNSSFGHQNNGLFANRPFSPSSFYKNQSKDGIKSGTSCYDISNAFERAESESVSLFSPNSSSKTSSYILKNVAPVRSGPFWTNASPSLLSPSLPKRNRIVSRRPSLKPLMKDKKRSRAEFHEEEEAYFGPNKMLAKVLAEKEKREKEKEKKKDIYDLYVPLIPARSTKNATRILKTVSGLDPDECTCEICIPTVPSSDGMAREISEHLDELIKLKHSRK